MSSADEVNLQRQYYADTAAKYDAMQISEQDEHQFALAILSAMIEFHDIKSVLDVGSGTGRALRYLKSRHPGVRFVGIEPVEALRKVGHQAGLSPDELKDGDINALAAADGEFDLVCEFAVLHHVPKPKQAVAEMLRVARKAIFISDANNFGQGGLMSRCLKQGINALGLWRVFDWLRTGGKGYHSQLAMAFSTPTRLSMTIVSYVRLADPSITSTRSMPAQALPVRRRMSHF